MNNVGAMLRLARQLRGLGQGEASVKLGVNNAELSRFENGVREPSADVIRAAAVLYNLPASFFDQTDAVYGAPVSVHPLYRKKADVSATELHRVVAELNVRVMHLRRLLDATELESAREVPRLDSDSYDNDAERIAAIVRGHWQVPAGPIPDLTALVEQAGVVVAHSDFGGSSISGVTFRVPGVPPLVVLNRAHPADRMRFTLGHEVGHIVMHRLPTPNMEEEADRFASCLLVPTDDIQPYLEGRKVDLRLLAALKPEWRVSMASLVFAAQRCRAITAAQATWLWKQFAMHKYRLREPPELDFAPEEPRTLSDLISLHLEDLVYSLSDLAKIVRVHETEFARTYSITLLAEKAGKPAHLRIVK
jgi:Zn-dependent peptidase ImmA (M78 family)